MRYEGRIVYAQAFDAVDATGVEVEIHSNRLVRIVDGQGVIEHDGTNATDREGVGIAVEAYKPVAAGDFFPTQHKGVTVALVGTALVEANGPIKRGQRCKPVAGGKVVADAAGAFRAWTDATIAGDLVQIAVQAF